MNHDTLPGKRALSFFGVSRFASHFRKLHKLPSPRPGLAGICIVLLSIFSSFLFVSCSSTSFVNIQSLKTRLGLKAFPGVAQYPDADEVILSNVHNVHAAINRDGDVETDVYVTRVIELLRNVDGHASVQLHVYPGETIHGLRARTIEPDGSSIVLSKSDFHTITGGGSGYVFYTNEKKIRFTFPAVQKNCIIEYHYITHETHPFIQDVWEIQGMYPELENRYSLTVPLLLVLPVARGGYGWNWRYKVYNCKIGKPTYNADLDYNEAPSQQPLTFTWTENGIPAFKPDPKMPPYLDYIRYVKFAPSAWKTWNDISEWYYGDLFKPQLDMTPAISRKAQELAEGCANESQKIERAFDFVQSLRYIAIELGQGGYVPSKPAVVMRRMYGDCKDKSILLVSLLRSLGINAKPVLVLTSDEGTVDPNFPSWMFNHMIVKATARNGKVYWLDATADHCGLGEIPYQDQGTNALVLNYDNTSEIERIPSARFTENAEDILANVKIDSSGEADFSVDMQFKGEENLETRFYLAGKSHDDMVTFCKSLVAENYLDSKVENYSIDNRDNFDTTLVLHFSLRVPNAFRTQNNMIFLNIDPFRISGDWSWLARDHRNFPIDFDYPRTIIKTINVKLPGEYRIQKLPANTVTRAGGLYFSKSYVRSDSTSFVVTETFAITSRIVGKDKFDAVKKFAEKMRASSDELILLARKHGSL